MADENPQLRYAVLRHERIERPHFDFLLESAPGAALSSWRVPCWPITAPVRMEKLADHRRLYLDYEGEVSGSRGVVRRVESGTYVCKPRGNDPLAFDLRLTRDAGDASPTHLWLLAPPRYEWTLEPADETGAGG